LGVSILQYKRFLHQCNYVARFEEKHPNEREIHFKIHLTEERTNLYKDLKLERQLGKSLHALDENGKILSFQNYEEILHLFFRIRMKFYEKRKQYLFQYYQQMVQELNLETLFIQKVLDNPQEPDLTEIPPHFVQKFKNMTISRLESQNIDKCQAKILEFTQLVQYYQSVTPRDLYEKDLNELEIKLQLNSKRKRGGPSI